MYTYTISKIRAVLFLLACVFLMVACAEKSAPKVAPPESTPKIQEKDAKLEPPLIQFTDVSTEMGLDFVLENGAFGEKWFPETMLGGVAFFDYNNDGFSDLIAVRGSTLNGKTSPGYRSLILYQNIEGKRFVDVTADVGLAYSGYGMGLALGDFDGDGWNDIYITAFGKNTLYKNNQAQSFMDVTDRFGVAGNDGDFSTAASFIDIDNDGDLDLFVGDYLDWSIEKDNEIEVTYNGKEKMYPHPNSFKGKPSRIYRNDFPQPFSAVDLGISLKNVAPYLAKALGVLPIDINNDHYLDLVIANDSMKNYAFINDTKGGFAEKSDSLGLSYNNLGLPTAAMGMASTWSGSDLSLHIAMGNFSNEMTSVYRYDDAGFFVDVSPLTGIGSKTRMAFTFGVLFADLDLDGFDEFIQANGDVEPDIKKIQKALSYRQSPQVFWQCGSRCPRQFMQLPDEMVGEITNPLVGRGLAAADIDHDGDLDLVISSVGDSLKLYRNDQQLGNNWLAVSLVNKGRNPNGIGSIVEINYKGSKQRKSLMPTAGYLSQSEAVVYFGLGDAKSVDKIAITWPGGEEQIIGSTAVNQRLVVRRAEVE